MVWRDPANPPRLFRRSRTEYIAAIRGRQDFCFLIRGAGASQGGVAGCARRALSHRFVPISEQRRFSSCKAYSNAAALLRDGHEKTCCGGRFMVFRPQYPPHDRAFAVQRANATWWLFLPSRSRFSTDVSNPAWRANASPRYTCVWSQQGLRGCRESGSMQQPNAAKNASHFFGGDGEPLGDTGHFLAFAQPYLRDDHLRELFSYLLEVLWPTMPCDQARNVSSIPVERMILDFRMAAMPPWSRAAWANAASCRGNKG
jgi:hypothetical protein